MRIMLVVILVGILAILGFGVYSIRTSTHDPEVWHVDPRAVAPSATPNSFRAAPQAITEQPVDMEAPTFEVNAAQLAIAFDTFVMEQPRVERVAGTLESGWVTYVQRSETLAFPDYITVQFFDLGDTNTSTLALYSRSRYGHSDMGVNEARARAWLTSIESFVQ